MITHHVTPTQGLSQRDVTQLHFCRIQSRDLADRQAVAAILSNEADSVMTRTSPVGRVRC